MQGRPHRTVVVRPIGLMGPIGLIQGRPSSTPAVAGNAEET
jgi:hypothetical protein